MMGRAGGEVMNIEKVTAEQARQRAKELFLQEKYSCSEAVFATVNECMDEPLPDELVRLAAGFRGGMGGSGGVCGALSGGVMALGLALGNDAPGGPSEALSEAVRTLRERFISGCGNVCCKDLIAGFEDHDDPKRREFCAEIVATAVCGAVEILQGQDAEEPKA